MFSVFGRNYPSSPTDWNLRCTRKLAMRCWTIWALKIMVLFWMKYEHYWALEGLNISPVISQHCFSISNNCSFCKAKKCERCNISSFKCAFFVLNKWKYESVTHIVDHPHTGGWSLRQSTVRNTTLFSTVKLLTVINVIIIRFLMWLWNICKFFHFLNLQQSLSWLRI